MYLRAVLTWPVQAARTRLEQIEEHVGLIKDKIMESRLGRSSFKYVSSCTTGCADPAQDSITRRREPDGPQHQRCHPREDD